MFFARSRRSSRSHAGELLAEESTGRDRPDDATQAVAEPTVVPQEKGGAGSRRPSSWDLREGDDLVAGVRTVRKLGGGASYEAYLAFDEHTWSPVVVKVLRPDLVEDASARRGLRREIRALATINHPVVLRGLRHDENAERPHLVLECIDGPRLSSLVRRYGPLGEPQYLPLGIDIASSLHYLRRIGWTHLDIKPSNIIMGAPARLIDLSVAREVEDAATLAVPIGTDAYMAPEQADPGRAGVPGPASDVWGLGSTLFHAIAGERPFPDGDPDAEDPALSHPQTVLDPRPLPERTPALVVDVVRAMLDRDPAGRPEPREVSAALEPVLAAQPAAKLTFKVK